MKKQPIKKSTRLINAAKTENKWQNKSIQRRYLFFVQRYIGELSFDLPEKTIQRLQIFGQFLGTALLSALLAFVFLGNSAPLGMTIQYALGQDNKSISTLGPKDRVQEITINGQQVTQLKDDLIYFKTTMPFQFDSATVKVYFQNGSADQTFALGFQDEPTWHYNVKPFDMPFINTLNWFKIGTDPILYQRTPKYSSYSTFVNNPPTNEIIGTFDYDTRIGDNSKINLPSYTPQKENTIINTALRGTQVLYVYLDNEPFHMKIHKQDLNWYEGPDPATVSIYKDNNLLMQQTVGDDGITDNSRKLLSPQELDINNPGPGFPESGVYKVVIKADGDTLIKQIETNLHKIVFAGSLFLAGGPVYTNAVATTSAATVYTNALSLSALTYHALSEQTIFVDNQPYKLNMLQIPLIITPQNELTKVVVPKNDVILNALLGYFSFSPDQFFLPSQYHVMPVTKADDVPLVDYIVTQYQPSHQEAGWQTNTQTFDLSSAYIQHDKLNWVIEAPNLKKSGSILIIKDIQVTFHKKGWNT